MRSFLEMYTPINEIKGRIINAISPGASPPREDEDANEEEMPMSPSFEVKQALNDMANKQQG